MLLKFYNSCQPHISNPVRSYHRRGVVFFFQLHQTVDVSICNKQCSFCPPLKCSHFSSNYISVPLFSSILSFHPNIPPFILVCQSNKFSQGAFRQNAITHVTTGAKSEHRGQHDASMLEMYSEGFIVTYFI